jgi:hypothetical protein
MANLSKSPERHTFQKNAYIERCKQEGKDPDPSIVEMYNSFTNKPEYENRPEYDLEYELRTTDWILEKVRTSDSYAQNLYAAMCNMRWQPYEVWSVLKDEHWTCSWRGAGGIVADLRNCGEGYMDWYCSGIVGDDLPEDHIAHKYVPEGEVTDEILADLARLGWRPSPYPRSMNGVLLL